MPINAVCTGCHKTLHVPDSTVGRRVRCPLCQTVFRVAAPATPPGEFDTGVEERDPAAVPAGRSAEGEGMPEPEEIPVSAPTGRKRGGKAARDREAVMEEEAAPRKRARRDEDEEEAEDDRPVKKKGGKGKTVLFVCLGLLLLGCSGLAGAGWWFFGRSQGVDERLVGSWVVDPLMTMAVSAQLETTFPKDMQDLRYDFRQDGTCTLLAARTSRTGTWEKVRAEEKAVRIRFTDDKGTAEIFEFSILGKDGLAVEKGAPPCVLKRATGTPPTGQPGPGSPPATPEESAKITRMLGGKWKDKDGKPAWEFNPDGSAVQIRNGEARKATTRVLPDGGIDIDVSHPNPQARPGVAYTLHYKARSEGENLVLVNRENNFEMRFTRDTGATTPKVTPPPKVIEISSPRHNISRTDTVKTMNITGDGKVVAWTEAGLPQMLRVWGVSGSNVDVKIKPELPEGQSFEAVAFTPTGKVVAAGLNDGTIRRYAVGKGAAAKPWKAHGKAVTGIVYLTGKPLIVTASADGTVKSWNASDLTKPAATITASGPVYNLAVSPDGRYAFSLADPGPQLWDLQAGTEIKTALPRGIQKAAAFSPDGKTLAIAGDSSVTLFDVGTWNRRSALLGHTKLVNALAFDGSGKRLATGSDDTTVRIWDVATGHPLVVAKRHSDGVTCVALSGNGRVLASGGRDKSVYVWSVPGIR